MSSNYTGIGSYNVDIVMCIDATGSMKPLIDTVKRNALSFYSDVKKGLDEKNKKIDELRVKLVVFRDYLEDGDKAMLVTDFINLPENASEFEKLAKSIEADGGGDDEEDALEALGYAIKSKWSTKQGKKRQIIVLWTDAPAHELGFGKAAKNYPSKMAKNFSELSEWWGVGDTPNAVMNKSAKRLVLYAPDVSPWDKIESMWDNVVMLPSKAGQGLDNVSYNEILNEVVNSIQFDAN